jgi:hypothetical protein
VIVPRIDKAGTEVRGLTSLSSSRTFTPGG